MDTVHYRRDYVLKVWGMTIVITPIIIMLLTTIKMASKGELIDDGAGGFILFSIIYGVLFSIPTLLVVYLLFLLLRRLLIGSLLIKTSLIATANICIFLTFYFFFGKEIFKLDSNNGGLIFSLTYIICLTVFGFIFPVGSKAHGL